MPHDHILGLLAEPLDSAGSHRHGFGAVADHAERKTPANLAPCGEQGSDPLLRREAADEERIAAIAIARHRIVGQKIRLDRQFLGGEPEFNEFPAGRLREGNERIDLAGPGPKPAVRHLHRHDGGAAGKAAAIAAVTERRPGHRPPDTKPADLSIPELRRAGTEEPIIVQGLHTGNALGFYGVVQGRREQGEEIMDMDHIEMPGAQ